MPQTNSGLEVVPLVIRTSVDHPIAHRDQSFFGSLADKSADSAHGRSPAALQAPLPTLEATVLSYRATIRCATWRLSNFRRAFSFPTTPICRRFTLSRDSSNSPL